MTEHEVAQREFSANRERLKAERLEREAAGTTTAATCCPPHTTRQDTQLSLEGFVVEMRLGVSWLLLLEDGLLWFSRAQVTDGDNR